MTAAPTAGRSLPPCPYCGKGNLHITNTTFTPGGFGEELNMDFVECVDCYLSMPLIHYQVFAIECHANRKAANHWDQSQPPGLKHWSVHRCRDGWFIQDLTVHSLFTTLPDDDTHPALGALLNSIIRAKVEVEFLNATGAKRGSAFLDQAARPALPGGNGKEAAAE